MFTSTAGLVKYGASVIPLISYNSCGSKARDNVPRSDACQFAYMYAQPTCDIWSALWEFWDSIVAALTNCHVLARKYLFCLNSHRKAYHIVNVEADDLLK